MSTLAPESVRSNPEAADFFSAADIARALSLHKRRVLRAARHEHWPSRTDGYRLLFHPPPDIAALIVATPACSRNLQVAPPAVHFADLVHSDAQRELVMRRETAVKLLSANSHVGREAALALTARLVAEQFPGFRCKPGSLRKWSKLYAAHGLDGLVEQKLGIVGRKSFALDLDQDEVLRYRAAAVEFGAARKGDGAPQLNIARAYRGLVADPTVTGPARAWLHGAHASKSYVPPSVRTALTAAPLTASLIQRGPKAAKLDGAWTECDYANIRAGDAFTADDMTANCYVWAEWPNEQGFLFIRPQILAAMDIGSMSWLCLRAVMRPRGQYNHDDVWGLIGDVFDDFGLFPTAVLEGGTWQSKEITGQLCDDEVRFGGLRALGCKVIHTRTPRGKIIEGAFNQLQYAADRVPGFTGRMAMKDQPEVTRKNISLIEHGHAHPRELFMHVSDYRAHLAAVMNDLNHERSDGKILRGQCPADKWADDCSRNLQVAPRRAIPDSSKWMYRSSYRVNEVTRNGVRISTGTGKYALHYYYSAPALVPQRGRRVAVFWNDYDPDTDAVIYSIRGGKPHELICVAPRVQTLPRFGASEQQWAAESTRRAALANVARVERDSLAPYLARECSRDLQVAPTVARTDARLTTDLQSVRAARATLVARQTRVRRALNRAVDVTADDLAAATSPSPGGEGRGEGERFSPDEIADLFRDET